MIKDGVSGRYQLGIIPSSLCFYLLFLRDGTGRHIGDLRVLV